MVIRPEEPSGEPGRLSSSLIDAGDPDFPRRMAIAFAVAVAFHEIAAGFFPKPEPPKPAERIVAQVVSISRRPKPTPKPTPQPTPRLTPSPAPRFTLAPQTAVRAPAPRAAATPRRHLGGAAARRHVAVVKPRPVPTPRRAPPRSLVNGTKVGLQGGGAGTGAGAGIGEGGQNGTGSGTNGRGNGNGAEAATAPCGFVTFYGKLDHVARDGTQYEHVRLVVTLRDGSTLSDELHWFFVYKDEQSNPFAPVHRNDDYPAVLQSPPPGFDPSVQQPATVFALQHTDPQGYTTLPECPTQSGADSGTASSSP